MHLFNMKTVFHPFVFSTPTFFFWPKAELFSRKKIATPLYRNRASGYVKGNKEVTPNKNAEKQFLIA
jgi:hypothetical protein